MFMVEPSPQSVLTQEEIFVGFPSVFSDGVGQLSGEYNIRIDPNSQPVQHAPRCVAVALRPKPRETLEDLVEEDVIAPVTTPTPWISSVAVVPKKNGKLRVCLDPKDLNNAI